MSKSRATVDPQAAPAPDRLRTQKRFRVNLAIFLGVNALLAVTWVAVVLAGVPMRNIGVSVAIYVGLMVLWGARVVLTGLRAYRGG